MLSQDVDTAKAWAERLHQGQKDKAGKPYIDHPARVAGRLKKAEEKVVAWLHDTVEDTGLPLQEERLLLRGLQEGAVYRVEETGEEASGQHWMKKGLPLSFSGQGPWDSIYVHLEML